MKKYILIQGAMEIEIEHFLNKMEGINVEIINGYKFYIGSIKKRDVIVSLTKEGMLNASISTFTALSNYDISFIINQGIAGAHRDYIKINDIIVATNMININSFITPRKTNKSNSLLWEFYEENNPPIATNVDLLDRIKMSNFDKSKIYYGNIGSGDIFNREKERIKFISEKKDTLCEEMEGYGVYMTCEKLNIPCVGIRTISNNELLGLGLDKNSAKISQEFVISVLNKF